MKIWIFGQSMCLPHGVADKQGWPFLLSQQLNASYENFAEPGADNFFIYHTFLENYQRIAPDDLVIVGWSHPLRKSFVYNDTNPVHQELQSSSLQYATATKRFFRNLNSTPSTQVKWMSMDPQTTGVEFYDHWFNHYYSEYEQRCNFQSYLDSVELRSPGQYIPFYFSKESVDQIINHNRSFMLEFISTNNVAISNDDFHMNETGHRLWASHLLEQIK